MIRKKNLARDDKKFLAKVNPKWFPELVELASKHIGKKNQDFVVLYSGDLNMNTIFYANIYN
jgi:hypothetical protein